MDAMNRETKKKYTEYNNKLTYKVKRIKEKTRING